MSVRPHGVDHHNARLDPMKVRAIRGMSDRPYRYLAELFGVSIGTISNVINEKIWKSVTAEAPSVGEPRD